MRLFRATEPSETVNHSPAKAQRAASREKAFMPILRTQMRANIALVAIGLQVGEIHQHQTIHAVVEIRVAAEIDKLTRRPARTLPSTAYTAGDRAAEVAEQGLQPGGRRCNPPRQTAPARRAATPDKGDATPPADASPGTTAGRMPPADRGRRAAIRQKSTPDQTDSDSADSAPDKRRCRTTGSPARDAPSSAAG